MTEVVENTKQWIAGVDEVGRGPLAGPVVACAVILPDDHDMVLKDSKKMSALKREAVAFEIQQRAVGWAIGVASVEEIDEINILQASLLAMKRAIEQLNQPLTAVWVDGIHAPSCEVPVTTIIQGDAKVPAISAASIVAKVYRDEWMVEADKNFSGYGFAQHKGYGTRQHLEALKSLGACSLHRRSFSPVQRVLKQL